MKLTTKRKIKIIEEVIKLIHTAGRNYWNRNGICRSLMLVTGTNCVTPDRMGMKNPNSKEYHYELVGGYWWSCTKRGDAARVRYLRKHLRALKRSLR